MGVFAALPGLGAVKGVDRGGAWWGGAGGMGLALSLGVHFSGLFSKPK